MPRGQPDYGAYAVKEVGASLSDMADLAVRLSSIVEYDRRGDIVSLDDFEESILKWSTLGTAGGSAVLDSSVAKSGSQSVKITTSSVANSIQTIRKSFVILGTKRVGIEISFNDLPSDMDFYFSVSYWDGSAGRQANVWFDRSETSFYVEDATSGNWTLIGNVGGLRSGEKLFYPLKLVADFTTNKYARFLFCNVEYDLSAITIPPFALSGGAYFCVSFIAKNISATSYNIYLDDFIFTQNEP